MDEFRAIYSRVFTNSGSIAGLGWKNNHQSTPGTNWLFEWSWVVWKLWSLVISTGRTCISGVLSAKTMGRPAGFGWIHCKYNPGHGQKTHRKQAGDVIQQIVTTRHREKLAILLWDYFWYLSCSVATLVHSKTMGTRDGCVHIERMVRSLSAASGRGQPEVGQCRTTDCATLPEEQGKGFACLLSSGRTTHSAEDNLPLYGYAAPSLRMNKVFTILGYNFSGCLVNNCNIYSGIENMNVWHKLIKLMSGLETVMWHCY